MSNTFKIEEIVPGLGYAIIEPARTPKEVAGIYNPKKDKEVPQWGKVVKAAPPTQEQAKAMGLANADYPWKPIYEPGTTVIYKKWGGNDVTIGDKTYYFLKYEEIIGSATNDNS